MNGYLHLNSNKVAKKGQSFGPISLLFSHWAIKNRKKFGVTQLSLPFFFISHPTSNLSENPLALSLKYIKDSVDFLSQISVSHNIPQFLRSLLKFLLIQDSYPENPVEST